MSSQPNPSYDKQLEELLSLEFTGMKLGLDNIYDLLGSLGDPQETYPTIHIAGTNGKGSVSAMIAAVLTAHGYKTGLYTSPHLVDFRERIKINGAIVSKEAISDILTSLWSEVERLQATFFEVATAIAFEYFKRENVDVAVIETGLGGRLDATNVLTHPLVTSVTSIGLEHTQFLGDTLEKIAGEKAGIFKSGVPAVVNVPNELRHVFLKKAADVGTTVLFTDDYVVPAHLRELTSPLLGEHQRDNLRTVLAALSVISLPLKTELIVDGIERTVPLSGIRARLEQYDDKRVTEKKATMFLDAGHNADAFKALKDHFIQAGTKPVVVFGLAKDKNATEIALLIKAFASRVITVEANSHRAVQSSELATLTKGLGIETTDGGSVISGIERAVGEIRPGETLLVCGSHFVIGEYLHYTEGKSLT